LQVCIGGFKTVKEALDCGTSDGDRIQIKAGTYKETMRITKPSRSRPIAAPWSLAADRKGHL
jgi:pectin methylesterase-like acyl-CoA thioesterase